MRPEWTAEISVDAKSAAALIAAQFPALAGAPVHRMAEGWDNTVYLVDGVWAFRFPRRRIALPGVAREIELLPRLAGRLPLAVPVPEHIGSPSVDYPWPFFGARSLPGRELAETAPADHVDLAAALGTFLRELHDPAVAADLGCGLPVDPMHRANPRRRGELAETRLRELQRRGTVGDLTAVEDLFAATADLPPPAGEPVLVHGDLHVRHVLVGGPNDGTVTGVIDWGDVCLADPAVDLAIAYAAFDGPARTALLEAYGTPVDREREARARVLAVSLSAALADYADLDHRPALLRESLAGLERAVR